jgi:transcriptional regulator with XRE-family HTH domain
MATGKRRGKWTRDYFSRRLKDEREKSGMTQDQLAKLLEDRGIAMRVETVARIEKGSRDVKIDEASAIADIFDTSVDSLLGRTVGGQEAEQSHAMDVLADEARKLASQMGGAADRMRLAYQHLSHQFGLDYIDASTAGGHSPLIPEEDSLTVEQRRAYLMWFFYQSATKTITDATGLLNGICTYRSMTAAEIPKAWDHLMTLTGGIDA